MNQTASPTAQSRRTFLGQTVLAGSAIAGFPAIVHSKSPGSKLNLAIIGAGGRGGSNLRSTQNSENIVALCDVNSKNLEYAASKFPKARKYKDFRKLYDDVKDVDAVVVSTTEHTHAFATLPALQMKKHVYCEKPLTRDVYEARVITEAAAKAGVATQMGTQIHASNNYREVVELIRAQAIGAVREVHVWVSRAWGWQSQADSKQHKDRVWSFERPKESMTPPDYLDWDLWLGPAPYRPYHEIYFPGPKWYRWWDFGNGTMSDLGSHWNDLPFWALDLDAPIAVEASGPPAHPEIAPASMAAKYTYGPRGKRPGLTLTWHQGENKPEIWTNKGIPQWATTACCFPITASICSCRKTSSRAFRPRNRRSPAPSATTPNGSAPARPGNRPPVISATPAPSPKPTTWATWLTVPGKISLGMRQT
jgi:predicted dehydrogenase